jgi:hypothetical protein
MDLENISDSELIEIYQNIDEFIKYLGKAEHLDK